MLIHDGQYDYKSYEKKKNWGHSAWQEVVRQAREAGVPRLVLTHHDPDADDEALDQRCKVIDRKYRGDFKTLELAREQATFTL